jgi:hypothetical protein
MSDALSAPETKADRMAAAMNVQPTRALDEQIRVRWRRLLILQRAVLSQAWLRHFPLHDFATGRLQRHSIDGFDEAVEQMARENKVRRKKQHDGRIPENWEEISLDALLEHFNAHRPTPRVTVEAIMLCVRERGVAALSDSDNIKRLSRCSTAAKAEINRRISALKKLGRVQ